MFHPNKMLRLHDVQDEITRLKAERDELIQEVVKDGTGVRELARFLNMSPAQISRTSRKVKNVRDS